MIPLNQEGSLVQRAETTPERTEPGRTIVLVTELENEADVAESKIAPLNTLMPQPTTTTASQELSATLVTAQTLLLLTSSPKYNRTATPAISEP